MPFSPHTTDDTHEMLSTIGIETIEQLFDEIPADLKIDQLAGVPGAINEQAITRLMQERAAGDSNGLNFIGAGAYEHHIPAAVWEIATRGEFYSAYTPYQAEASQGTLQLVYEYQSMMASLTGMEVSNASLYDGASALAEAVLMAARANRKSRSKRILMPTTLHPTYRDTTRTIVAHQGFELEALPHDPGTGRIDPDQLEAYSGADITALVIPQPNFFGVLEEVHRLTDWAARNQTLVIAVVNPVTLAVLAPPGEWGETGADIVCGDGQPLGAPLSSGGPYYGLMCCKQAYVRQMPGRIVGRTVDADGRPGFVLTLQAREQHIRRSKATSNICTNQGLVVTASTIHMSLLGNEGLERVAATCYTNTHNLVARLAPLGVKPIFTGEYFHEVALRLPKPAAQVLHRMGEAGVFAGYDLGQIDTGLSDCLLVCATETKTEADLNRYVEVMQQTLQA